MIKYIVLVILLTSCGGGGGINYTVEGTEQWLPTTEEQNMIDLAELLLIEYEGYAIGIRSVVMYRHLDALGPGNVSLRDVGTQQGYCNDPLNPYPLIGCVNSMLHEGFVMMWAMQPDRMEELNQQLKPEDRFDPCRFYGTNIIRSYFHEKLHLYYGSAEGSVIAEHDKLLWQVFKERYTDVMIALIPISICWSNNL